MNSQLRPWLVYLALFGASAVVFLGVLSPRLFAMLVVMAVVTTLLTSPVLRRLVRQRAAA